MDDPSGDICKLFHTVLQQEMLKFFVDEETIRQQIGIMREVYLPNKGWKKDIVSKGVDYNDPAARCAYVHKYAMCYTGMVNSLLTYAASNCTTLQYLNEREELDICSLGGGPGTDVVGILNVFTNFFDCLFYHATVIDYIKHWEKFFSSVIKELRSGKYGDLSDTVAKKYFTYEYMQANLFNINMNVNSPLNLNVIQAIASSDFLSMIKFVSAAACDLTQRMVNEVFNCTKCGAIVGNAADGLLQKEENQGDTCEPLEHCECEEVSTRLRMKNYSQELSSDQDSLTEKMNLLAINDIDSKILFLNVSSRSSNQSKRQNQRRQVKAQPNSLNLKRRVKKQPNHLNRQVKKQPKPNNLNRSNSSHGYRIQGKKASNASNRSRGDHSKHDSNETNQLCPQNRPPISISTKRPLNKRKQPYRTRNVKTKRRKVKRQQFNLFRTNRRSKRKSQSMGCCCTIL